MTKVILYMPKKYLELNRYTGNFKGGCSGSVVGSALDCYNEAHGIDTHQKLSSLFHYTNHKIYVTQLVIIVIYFAAVLSLIKIKYLTTLNEIYMTSNLEVPHTSKYADI